MNEARVEIRPATAADVGALTSHLDAVGMRLVARLGELLDASAQPAFMAERDGVLVGAATTVDHGDAWEVLTLFAEPRQRGVGTLLLDAVAAAATAAGARRLWLLTTNDNVDALRFYQRRGFRLARLVAGGVDRSRAELKPTLPAAGAYDIPIRDELILERPLVDGTVRAETSQDRPELRDHERRNQADWDADSDAYQARHAAQLDVHGGLAWGVFQIPEAELRILGDVAGKDVLELGCGAAQWSIGLARLGARPVGLDLSARQLEHARGAMTAAGLDFPLVHGSAESVPLPEASFDIVFCDHGAMTFADPYRTVPEAARLLRPGGLFAFSHGSAFADVHWAIGDDAPGTELVHDYFGLRSFEEDGSISFQLPYGAWIRLFRDNGLLVEDLIEPPAPADATSSYRDAASIAWSKRWPAESIWRLRKEP